LKVHALPIGQTMAISLNDRMKALKPERRRKIEAHTAQLVAGEMMLQKLRRARKLTRVRIAKSRE